MLLKDVTFCAFDVETTGLSFFSKLVEIGAARFHIGGEPEQFSTLIDPGQPIPPETTLIHGIDDDMVQGAPAAPEALGLFSDFADGCVLVAHNASFDAGIMSVEAGRAGVQLPDAPILDNLKIARAFLKGYDNYQLPTLAMAFGLDVYSMHRGLADSIALKKVFEEAVYSIPGWQEATLDSLIDSAAVIHFSDYVDTEIELPVELSLLMQAYECGENILIVYDGGSKGFIPRSITPVGFFARKGIVYVEAFCHIDGFSKSYRLDRIISIETGE